MLCPWYIGIHFSTLKMFSSLYCLLYSSRKKSNVWLEISSFLSCLCTEKQMCVMALGEQYASFLVTKVQYEVLQYRQMGKFLCHVGLIPREAKTINFMAAFEYLRSVDTLFWWYKPWFFSVRLWNVPIPSLMESDGSLSNETKVCFLCYLVWSSQFGCIFILLLFLNNCIFNLYFSQPLAVYVWKNAFW